MVGQLWDNGGTMVGQWWDNGGTMRRIFVHLYSVRTVFVPPFGGTMVGQWWDNGGTMVGQWWDNGGTMVGQWWDNGGQIRAIVCTPWWNNSAHFVHGRHLVGQWREIDGFGACA